MGLGMTVTVAPLTTTVMGAVEERHAGVASGINNAVSRTAALLAIAILGLVVLATFSNSLDSHLAALHLSPGMQQQIEIQRVKLAGITIPTNVSSETHAAIKQAIDESFVSSFHQVALICAALALISALSAWLLVEGKKPAQLEEGGHTSQDTAHESHSTPS